ncbi:MAG: gliding motility lipoprotein GldD [Bacteroidales bacterium]
MKYKLLTVIMLVALSCDRSYTPKPEGYIRVHFPEKEYQLFDESEMFSFEYPHYATVERNRSANAEPEWYDLNFPAYNGTLHLSYKQLNNNLDAYIEDTRTLVYKHTSRSEGIQEIPFVDRTNKRYGIRYELGGNVASTVQFFLTDSINHFLRGSLYFNSTPNRDSLNPIIRYVKQDIEHLMETVEWK